MRAAAHHTTQRFRLLSRSIVHTPVVTPSARRHPIRNRCARESDKQLAVPEAPAPLQCKLGDALEFYQGRLKLPNLDEVLPLPPAPLPAWDGNVQTLIDAAKGGMPH